MHVLLSNDDGIQSEGLQALYKELIKAGHQVDVVAPMEQQSGKSHSITVFEPLRAKEYQNDKIKGTGLYGSPSDCVKLGLGVICEKKPDLVISGINDGHNIGPDIFYSGTVGAAAEGAHAGIPSVAVSHAGRTDAEEMARTAEHVVKLLAKIDWEGLPKGRVLNINYPEGSVVNAKGIKVCSQSSAVMDNAFIEHTDPRGEKYWWMNCGIEDNKSKINDRNLLQDSYITITPLKFDYTDYNMLENLEKCFK